VSATLHLPVEQLIGSLSQAPCILRLPAVLKVRGRSRSTHYLDVKQGLFTRPVSLGARAVGWPAYEVAMLNAARIAGQGDEEIRSLVASLEDARKEIAFGSPALSSLYSASVLALLGCLGDFGKRAA
jgi:prophage regulatory protein